MQKSQVPHWMAFSIKGQILRVYTAQNSLFQISLLLWLLEHLVGSIVQFHYEAEQIPHISKKNTDLVLKGMRKWRLSPQAGKTRTCRQKPCFVPATFRRPQHLASGGLPGFQWLPLTFPKLRKAVPCVSRLAAQAFPSGS